MKGIHVKVIPHHLHRYNTCGDWWYARDNTWEIRVSKMDDWRYSFLIALHEIVEMAYCHYNEIKLEDVDAWDVEFEKNRKEQDFSEPGDHPNAPYYWGHQVASAIERTAAVFLGVNWVHYEHAINNL